MVRYNNYQDAVDAVGQSMEAFWEKAAEKLYWYKKWNKVLDVSESPHDVWFRGGECNICYNAVDRHVDAGRGTATALIYDSSMTGEKEQVSYQMLQDRVAKTAGMLERLGVKKGDRVVIYMPMIPEIIYAMLGCARIGAIHSVVFGGFAAAELSSRIVDSKEEVLVTALKKIFIVDQLPKTRSGKILRGTIQKIINGESYKISPTVENVGAIDVICEAV